MCIAIAKPAGKWVSKEHLYNSFNANRDGAGYAFLHKVSGQMVIKKGYFTFEEFYKEFSKDVDTDTHALIHFRISTAGKKDAANCHPFSLQNGAMMHNGPCINYSSCKGDKERSDTRQFAEDFVQTLSKEQIVAIRPMIESYIGSEKIVFLFNDGEFVFCNERNGQWHEGCWFSNSSFRGYFNQTGTAIRNYDDSYGHGYGGYGGYAGSHSAGGQAGQTDGAAGGKKGTSARYTGPVNRSFGRNNHLYPCAWSIELGCYVPTDIVIDGCHMIWVEKFRAFVPADCTRDLSWDKKYVYQATEEAEAREGGPSYKNDSDWDVVADCLKNEGEMRVFLREASPYTPPAAAPAPAPAAAPAAAPAPVGAPAAVGAPEAVSGPAPVTVSKNNAADASAAASSTVH